MGALDDLMRFSDVPNWRTREVGGYIAPGRYPKPIENRPDTDYSAFPLSQNIEDRRGERNILRELIGNLTMQDPMVSQFYNYFTKDKQLTPLVLPMAPPGGEALGANDLYPGMLGFDRYDQWRFDRGLTPGGPLSETPLKR